MPCHTLLTSPPCGKCMLVFQTQRGRMHRRMGQQGRACVAKDKVQNIQVLAAEHVSVASLAI